MISDEQKQIWLKAQEAEKGHWIGLWSDDEVQRKALFDHEAQKADFIFDTMIKHFRIDPNKNWKDSNILDVGCGPASIIARAEYGKTRTGADPLKYPDWVYDDYKKHDFKVLLQPFEELDTAKKFDTIIFYNALQHFANLGQVARKCQDVLAKGGVVYLSEYLEVPTNEAHIQFLEAAKLDGLFEGAGFNVDSTVVPVRLEGLVERPGGQPIDLYLAKLS